ncbi:cyclic nucleotide-binding domain-containing protein [Pararhizobium haloflavum]|uniref:cyclic nucleotide-binding domain-containing protein n=1 Tax=Pararhizobium haloflavum TaxID=2037914 RepID=UPI000C190DFA|nr:cyclic nucleotide-binding domain-containing protein [Pararhizobium haloflavum]
MALKDDIALLSTVPLFADLGEEQLRLIAFGAERRRVPGGQTLFRQGAPADCAYIVAGGRFSLTRSTRERKDLKLGEATKGALLGEIAMISLVERKMTAVAAETSEVIRITRPLFSRMLEEYPDLAVMMHRRISANLGRMVGELLAIAPRLRG